MEKLTHYQNILISLINEYGSIKFRYMPDVKKQKVIDTLNHHYLLLGIGKYKGDFVYMTTFHFNIIDGKIWVQCNNTDTEIEEELLERGVDYQDIVLAGEAVVA